MFQTSESKHFLTVVLFAISTCAFFILLVKYYIIKNDLTVKDIIWERKFKEFKLQIEIEFDKQLSQKVSSGVQKSKEVIRGKVTEELLPLLPGFPYQLSDCKFFGSPIDYIVFKNMSNYRDGINTDQVDIIIADVKNNKSSNTPIQNQIKKAILEKRFTFESWLIDDQNNITIKKY